MSEQALLEVENLRIDIVSGSSKHNVVEDVSFTIELARHSVWSESLAAEKASPRCR